MPDTRTHRGPHPEDARLFAASALPALRQATSDLCWLRSHGYAAPSALKLVGDRHQLAERQRSAIDRCACAQSAQALRAGHQLPADQLAGQPLWLDGYNVLTTIEVALGGAVVLGACDGTYRDIAGLHGTYRKVAETLPALELLGKEMERLRSSAWIWLLDLPVSNSGRLKTIMQDFARDHGWDWRIELVPDPDKALAESDNIVATADSAILDHCTQWFNLARETIDHRIPSANIVHLGVS